MTSEAVDDNSTIDWMELGLTLVGHLLLNHTVPKQIYLDYIQDRGSAFIYRTNKHLKDVCNYFVTVISYHHWHGIVQWFLTINLLSALGLHGVNEEA